MFTKSSFVQVLLGCMMLFTSLAFAQGRRPPLPPQIREPIQMPPHHRWDNDHRFGEWHRDWERIRQMRDKGSCAVEVPRFERDMVINRLSQHIRSVVSVRWNRENVQEGVTTRFYGTRCQVEAVKDVLEGFNRNTGKRFSVVELYTLAASVQDEEAARVINCLTTSGIGDLALFAMALRLRDDKRIENNRAEEALQDWRAQMMCSLARESFQTRKGIDIREFVSALTVRYGEYPQQY
ncbi:MAG: hypothetical protein AB7N80_13545 [Bdellovibrionales bacterium]